MTLDCYEFYLWSIGDLILPSDLCFELMSEFETANDPKQKGTDE